MKLYWTIYGQLWHFFYKRSGKTSLFWYHLNFYVTQAKCPVMLWILDILFFFPFPFSWNSDDFKYDMGISASLPTIFSRWLESVCMFVLLCIFDPTIIMPFGKFRMNNAWKNVGICVIILNLHTAHILSSSAFMLHSGAVRCCDCCLSLKETKLCVIITLLLVTAVFHWNYSQRAYFQMVTKMNEFV